MVDVNIFEHELVPKHEVVSEEEKQKLLKKLKVSEDQLPKIKSTDPVARILKAKKGDLIRIIRNSPTAGTSIYYRIVV